MCGEPSEVELTQGLAANESPYSGYAALPTPTAVGLAGAERVLTPEIYDGAPGGAADHVGVANEGPYRCCGVKLSNARGVLENKTRLCTKFQPKKTYW